jgi:hypothetical protein
MTSTFRDCPGCGAASEFTQVHPDPEPCPDVASGRCPEWFCITCGTGMLVELTQAVLDRVA